MGEKRRLLLRCCNPLTFFICQTSWPQKAQKVLLSSTSKAPFDSSIRKCYNSLMFVSHRDITVFVWTFFYSHNINALKRKTVCKIVKSSLDDAWNNFIEAALSWIMQSVFQSEPFLELKSENIKISAIMRTLLAWSLITEALWLNWRMKLDWISDVSSAQSHLLIWSDFAWNTIKSSDGKPADKHKHLYLHV